jgi:putative PIN family toxin of toxin-antitoxin system
MIRVVLDTNIIVSACLNEEGLPFYILKLALAEAIHMYVSEPILAEYDLWLRKRSRERCRHRDQRRRQVRPQLLPTWRPCEYV